MNYNYEENNIQLSYILKYCIFKDNKNTNGLILSGSNFQTDDETITYQQCLIPKTIDIYEYSGFFYAFNPLIRPVPIGTILFGLKINRSFPYNILQLFKQEDMYLLDLDSIYFIAWGLIVPYSTPLYFFTYNDNIYPSYTNKPPNKNWIPHELSPIFVLTKNEKNIQNFNINKYGDPVFTFISYDGRCIPKPGGITAIKCEVINNPSMHNTFGSFEEPSLIHKLNTIEINKKLNIKKFFNEITPIIICIILLIFSVSLIICVYILLCLTN